MLAIYALAVRARIANKKVSRANVEQMQRLAELIGAWSVGIDVLGIALLLWGLLD